MGLENSTSSNIKMPRKEKYAEKSRQQYNDRYVLRLDSFLDIILYNSTQFKMYICASKLGWCA